MHSQSTKVLFVAGTLLLVCIGAVLGASFILDREAESLQLKIQTVADEQAIISGQAALNHAISRTQSDREELSQYILQGDDGAAAFLSEVEALAGALGVEVTTDSLDATPGTNSDFGRLSVGFSFSGQEQAILQLIKLFATLPYASEVISLQYGRSQNPATGLTLVNGRLSLEISITAL